MFSLNFDVQPCKPVAPTTYISLHIWPKLFERVGRHTSREPLRRAEERVFDVGFTGGTPCIGEEVAAHDPNVAGISGLRSPTLISRQKRKSPHISNTSLEGSLRHTKVARIFAESKADADFNRIFCGAPDHAYFETITEASPSRPIFP